MKIVIDIPEEIYKATQIIDVKYEDVIQIPLETIANGAPYDESVTEFADRCKECGKMKKGQWIDGECSVCGKGIYDLVEGEEWYENEQPNFCPFCGMKLEKEEKMTYGEIFDEFRKKFPNVECVDFRPADPMYVPQLKLPIPYALIIWLKDGRRMIYIAKGDNNETT